MPRPDPQTHALVVAAARGGLARLRARAPRLERLWRVLEAGLDESERRAAADLAPPTPLDLN